MPSDRGLCLVAEKKPLEIKEAPYNSPDPNEVVKNGALAINPVDYLLPIAADMIIPRAELPMIIRNDVAGTVVEVGEGVTRFKPGDRVLGQAVGLDKRSNKSSEGAVQEYTVPRTNMACPIPDWMSFENASVRSFHERLSRTPISGGSKPTQAY